MHFETLGQQRVLSPTQQFSNIRQQTSALLRSAAHSRHIIAQPVLTRAAVMEAPAQNAAKAKVLAASFAAAGLEQGWRLVREQGYCQFRSCHGVT